MALVTEVTTTPLSGLNHIDALLDTGPGWNWLTPTRNVIYYSFSVTGGNLESNSDISGEVTAFNVAQQSACLSQLAYISQLTGITFAAAATGVDADIHFANTNIISSASTSGLCSWQRGWSYNGSNVVTSYTASAYIYLDNVEWGMENKTPTAGSSGYQTLLHELGHALGLKHPFDGGQRLSAAEDNTANTLMSYTDSGGPYSTFSPYDVAALAWIYGGDGLAGKYGVATSGQYLIGNATSNSIIGGSGNDKLDGLAGNDIINGGAGYDTAIFSGNYANYALTKTSAGWTVASTAEGTDTLSNVERLKFSDKTVALDLTGNAGTTAKILGVVFGAASVLNTQYVGIGLTYLDDGMSYANLMQLALTAAGATSHTAVVNLLWTNLFGAAPTAIQAAPYVALLQNGSYTPGSLGILAADLDLNATNINLVGLQQTGIEYS